MNNDLVKLKYGFRIFTSTTSNKILLICFFDVPWNKEIHLKQHDDA